MTKGALAALDLIEERVAKFNAPFARKINYMYRLLKLDARRVELDPAGAPSPDFTFFTSYQGKLLAITDPRTELENSALIHIGRIIDSAINLLECTIDYRNSGETLSLNHYDKPAWQVAYAAHVSGRESIPHLLLIMQHDIDGKQDLLRGELRAVVMAMTGQHNQYKFRKHRTAPVLVLSFTGPQHGRILQAHLEGEQLAVRYSHLYDFTTWNNDVQLFARWALSIPAGNTK
ncbi:hypothetical protein F5884DRAFT_838166 [Xylogone sp. PMI_703]|nr:hypothetical protein F5884DRAFT_838166 [Xylogone sp. PMI_703]